MFDVALKSAGAQVVLATSSDDKYPPENIIDGYNLNFKPLSTLHYNRKLFSPTDTCIVSFSIYIKNRKILFAL